MAGARTRWSTPASCLIAVVSIAIAVGLATVIRTAHELSAQVVNPPDVRLEIRDRDDYRALSRILADPRVREAVRVRLEGGPCSALGSTVREGVTGPVFEVELDFPAEPRAGVTGGDRRLRAKADLDPAATGARPALRVVSRRAESHPSSVVFDELVEFDFLVSVLERRSAALTEPVVRGAVLRVVRIERVRHATGDLLIAAFEYEVPSQSTLLRRVATATHRPGSSLVFSEPIVK